VDDLKQIFSKKWFAARAGKLGQGMHASGKTSEVFNAGLPQTLIFLHGVPVEAHAASGIAHRVHMENHVLNFTQQRCPYHGCRCGELPADHEEPPLVAPSGIRPAPERHLYVCLNT